MIHLLIDTLCNSVLITGIVIIMMMMIESFNIESHGRIFSKVRGSSLRQVLLAAILGSVPGCIGGFAAVSLYSSRLLSFGALIAMMIASSGDEAFVMLAMMPDKALWIFALLFAIAIFFGVATDWVIKSRHITAFQTVRTEVRHSDRIEITDEKNRVDSSLPLRITADKGKYIAAEPGEKSVRTEPERQTDEAEKPDGQNTGRRSLTWQRIVLTAAIILFAVALAAGWMGHDHAVQETGKIRLNLLSEWWMNLIFAILCIVMLIILCFRSDRFIKETLWHHVLRKHLPNIFAWTFGVLLLIGILSEYIDLGRWVSDNTALMILLAVAVGIIPESGPHLIFVTMYASGLVPLPVLLASSISQDGHSSLPLLAEDKRSFVYAKLLNCIIALIVGFGSMLLF